MIIVSKQQQQQTKRNERAWFYLSLAWVGLVFALFHGCVTELRTLQATKDLLLQMEQQQQQFHGSSDDQPVSSIASVVGSTNDSLELASQTSNTTASLLDTLREAPSDGVSQISKAVSTGLLEGETTEAPKKGHLILHTGPSKTGTTSLQTDLTTAEDLGWLAKNDFHYAGRYYRPYFNKNKNRTVINRSESKLLTVARTMFQDDDSATDCSDFRRELEALYEELLLRAAAAKANATERDDDVSLSSSSSVHTVILSDEHFGNNWLNPADYEAIREAVQDDWKVTVVVGYRRLYEWLLSNKFQRDRTDRLRGGKEQWPSAGGRPLLPLFPDTLERDQWRQYYRYTDTLLQLVGTTFSKRMINLHASDDGSSLLTQFLCDALDGADYACARSRERDFAVEETVLNAREAAAVPSMYYDALATTAAEAGLIDEVAFQRKEVRNAIQLHQEETLGLTADDLPEVCPSREDLETLYERSLEMERLYMPSLLSDEAEGDLEHRDGFEAKVADHSYCWVDTAAVLSDPQWQQFFAQFGATNE